jgi:hypothetical protein
VVLSFSSQLYAQTTKTFVRVDATNSTYNVDFTKNHNIIVRNNDEGYILMEAGNDSLGTPPNSPMWKIRITATDNSGNVDWSYDYKPKALQGGFFTAAPFVVKPTFSGNGYVVAGIWNDRQNTDFLHKGLQHPFYLELDNAGNIVQINLQGHIQGSNVTGFAPLDLVAEESGYVVVGVQSDDMECVSCATKAGMISRLDNNFNETNNIAMGSSYTIDPTSTSIGKDSRFDAFNTIEKVPANKGGGYLIGGSITAEIDLTNPLLTSQAGASDIYLARLNDNLTVNWELTEVLSTSSSNEEHAVLGALKVDYNEDIIYAVANMFASISGNYDIFQIYKLDLATGSCLSASRDPEHTTTTEIFCSNVFFDNNELLVAGYGTSNTALFPTTAGSTLRPTIRKYDKATLSNIPNASFIVDSDNFQAYYKHGDFYSGYLGIMYDISTHLDIPSVKTTGAAGISNPVELNIPIIYYPKGWCMNSSDEPVFISIDQADALTSTSGPVTFSSTDQHYPTLGMNPDLTICHYNDEISGSNNNTCLISVNTNSAFITASSSILEDCERNLNTLVPMDCDPNALSPFKDEDPRIYYSQSENVLYYKSNYESPIGIHEKEPYQWRLYDISGRVLKTGFSNEAAFTVPTDIIISNGIYFISCTDNKGDEKTIKFSIAR